MNEHSSTPSTPRRGRWHRFVFSPLAAGLSWFPFNTAAIAGAAAGKAPNVHMRMRRSVLRRGEIHSVGPRPGNPRALGHSLAAFLPSLLAFSASLMTIYLVYAGWLYPLRPETFPHLAHPLTPVEELDGAWGGNTLLAAWAGHAAIALPIQVFSLLVLTGVLRLRAAWFRRLTATRVDDAS